MWYYEYCGIMMIYIFGDKQAMFSFYTLWLWQGGLDSFGVQYRIIHCVHCFVLLHTGSTLFWTLWKMLLCAHKKYTFSEFQLARHVIFCLPSSVCIYISHQEKSPQTSSEKRRPCQKYLEHSFFQIQNRPIRSLRFSEWCSGILS